MGHWREVLTVPIFELDYETLVCEPETTIRCLLEFSGVEWDEACLRFHESKRVFRTASYDQVNRPLYRTSIGRADAFRPHLEPLLSALGRDLEPASPDPSRRRLGCRLGNQSIGFGVRGGRRREKYVSKTDFTG